jgi:hypothetical protein
MFKVGGILGVCGIVLLYSWGARASYPNPSTTPRDLAVLAEGPVLVTSTRPIHGADHGVWLRLDLTGDVGLVLANHVRLNHEIVCQRTALPEQASICTIWFNRAGDARNAPSGDSDRLKFSDTVIGTARVGRVTRDTDLLWVDVSSPALANWFSQANGRDIHCAGTVCSFAISLYGSVVGVLPGVRGRSH